jgi:cell fate (sporulation/competence/biofilm development) regulator YmcA (YheA/YmcA/DUF963 family)
MLEGDAPEIEHDEVIWNCATELIDRVDKYVKHLRSEQREEGSSVPEEITKTVDALRLLRPVCHEIATQLNRHLYGKKQLPKNSTFRRKSEDADSLWEYWRRMVQDIDHTLHDFRFRDVTIPPKFRVSRGKCFAGPSSEITSDSEDAANLDDVTDKGGKSKASQDLASRVKAVEATIQRLPQPQPFQKDLVISDSVQLQGGDDILVRLTDRVVEGCIIRIVDQMRAAFVTYEDLPACFDEFQPIDRIKQQKEMPGPGEPSSSVASEEIVDATRPTQAVLCALGGEGEVRIANCGNNGSHSPHYSHFLTLHNFVKPIHQIKQRKEMSGPGEPSSSVASEEIGDATRPKQAVLCALGGEGEVRIANCGNNGSRSPHFSHFLILHNFVWVGPSCVYSIF